MFKGTQRIGVEFKRADAPVVTASMRVALAMRNWGMYFVQLRIA
jgi:hypothetical protein